MSKRELRRVKVYRLQPSTGDWLDEGTGHVECTIDKFEAPCLVVKSESNDTILLQSRISGDDIYNKQQETLILWNEQETQNDEESDLALSFQDKQGCIEIWEEICSIQQSLRNETLKIKDPSQQQPQQQQIDTDFNSCTVNLPPPNLGNIDQIQTTLSEPFTNIQKQCLATALLKEQYVPKLVDLWRTVHDLDSEAHYSKMYNIFKDIVLLNCVPLIEQVVNPSCVMDIMAALEHDPEQHIGAVKHSDFLKNKAKFKQVVQLNDIQLENKIHQTFRLQYLKDVALARTLDEATFGTINYMIFINNMQIISELASNENVLNSLFTKLKAGPTVEEELSDLLSFLSEMCDLAKHLELKNKIQFYEQLRTNGLFEIIERTITNPERKIRMTCADLLLNSVEHDPFLLRSYLLMQDQFQFMTLLLKILTTDSDCGVINVITDLLRHLCDVSNMEEAPKKEFLDVFYEHHATTLFAPLTLEIPQNKHHSEAEGLLKNNLCELLSSFLKNHSQWINNFLLKNHLVKSLLNLLKCNEKWLILSAIRFFRSFIDGDNNPFKDYIIKENLFEPIVQVFLVNGEKYNLLNSALLELFEHILKKNMYMRPIIKHIIELHYNKLKDIKHTQIFHKLKEIASSNSQWNGEIASENQAVGEEPSQITDNIRVRERNRFLESQSEEAWFDDEDEDSENSPPILPTKSERSVDPLLLQQEEEEGAATPPPPAAPPPPPPPEPIFSLSEFRNRKRGWKENDDEPNMLGILKESATKRLKKTERLKTTEGQKK